MCNNCKVRLTTAFVTLYKASGRAWEGWGRIVDRRIQEHNSGRSKTTKKQLPMVLIHVEICKNRVEARNLEVYFKSGYGREIIDEIAGVAEWQTQRP